MHFTALAHLSEVLYMSVVDIKSHFTDKMKMEREKVGARSLKIRGKIDFYAFFYTMILLCKSVLKCTVFTGWIFFMSPFLDFSIQETEVRRIKFVRQADVPCAHEDNTKGTWG